jgi:hypothetical protein
MDWKTRHLIHPRYWKWLACCDERSKKFLVGDTRRHKHFVPITPRVLQSFLDAGFILREDIIKMQWKMKSTREKWRGNKYDFLLIAHEHLYVFRKPDKDEKIGQFKESIKWG